MIDTKAMRASHDGEGSRSAQGDIRALCDEIDALRVENKALRAERYDAIRSAEEAQDDLVRITTRADAAEQRVAGLVEVLRTARAFMDTLSTMRPVVAPKSLVDAADSALADPDTLTIAGQWARVDAHGNDATEAALQKQIDANDRLREQLNETLAVLDADVGESVVDAARDVQRLWSADIARADAAEQHVSGLVEVLTKLSNMNDDARMREVARDAVADPDTLAIAGRWVSKEEHAKVIAERDEAVQDWEEVCGTPEAKIRGTWLDKLRTEVARLRAVIADKAAVFDGYAEHHEYRAIAYEGAAEQNQVRLDAPSAIDMAVRTAKEHRAHAADLRAALGEQPRPSSSVGASGHPADANPAGSSTTASSLAEAANPSAPSTTCEHKP